MLIEPIKSEECLFVFHLGPKQDGWTVALIELFSRGFTAEIEICGGQSDTERFSSRGSSAFSWHNSTTAPCFSTHPVPTLYKPTNLIRVINTKNRTICRQFQQMLTSQKEFPSSKLSLHYGD
jgi:hypothetical protein